MKHTIMLVTPLLIAACSPAAQMAPSTTADVAQPAWAAATVPSGDAPALSSAKLDTPAAPSSANANQEQSKGFTPPAAKGRDDDKPSQVFPDRRSVEAMDRLAVSIPVRQTARGDLVNLASDDTFDPGSANTTASARWRLEDIAVALAAQSNRKIRVEVYADSVGDRTETQRLSQLRADALKDYFVSRGARADAIEAVGLGSAHPLASNLTAEGRRTNRRIELVVERRGQ